MTAGFHWPLDYGLGVASVSSVIVGVTALYYSLGIATATKLIVSERELMNTPAAQRQQRLNSWLGYVDEWRQLMKHGHLRLSLTLPSPTRPSGPVKPTSGPSGPVSAEKTSEGSGSTGTPASNVLSFPSRKVRTEQASRSIGKQGEWQQVSRSISVPTWVSLAQSQSGGPPPPSF